MRENIMKKLLFIVLAIITNYLFISLTQETSATSSISKDLTTVSRKVNQSQSLEFSSLGCNVSVRVGSLFAGETNYVVASNFPDSNGECNPKKSNPGIIQVFRPNLESVTIELPKNASSRIKLVDVTDLNNDGIDEIIAVNDVFDVNENNLAAFFIYSISKPKEPLVFLTARYKRLSGQEYMAEHLSVNHIKIYELTNQNKVVTVATDIAGTNYDGIVHFYQLDKNNVVKDNPQILLSSCKEETLECRIKNDAMAFPMIAVDDIDGDGFKEIVVSPKSKVLVFKGEGKDQKEIGQALYFTQFVDPQGNVSSYNVFKDYDGEKGSIGYRYGQIEIVPDLDNDGIKDLISLADAIPQESYQKDEPAYTILQAFKLQSPRNAIGGFLKSLGPLTSPSTNPSFTGITVEGANRFTNSIEGDPPVGCTLNSVKDIDGDGNIDVVISGYQPTSNSTYQLAKPFVDIYRFNASTGWKKIKRFKGICLDVTSLDNSADKKALPDIIIWNKVASSIDIWRWNKETKKFALLGEILARSWPFLQDSSNFALSNSYGDYEKHGSSSNFHSLIIIDLPKVGKTLIQNEKLTFGDCGSIKGWNTNNGKLNQVLSMEALPGKIMTLSGKSDSRNSTDNSEIIFNIFENCSNPSGVIKPYIYKEDSFLLTPKF